MFNRVAITYIVAACTSLLAFDVATAQAPSTSIVAIDFVRAKPGELPRLLRYYELNWAAARRTVLEQGGISGYKLLVNSDTANRWDIVLQTEYPDSASYARREETFAPVLAAKGKILVEGLDRPALGDIIESAVVRVQVSGARRVPR